MASSACAPSVGSASTTTWRRSNRRWRSWRLANRQLRLLLHLGPEFTGFGEGAWGDLTRELRSTPFHRGAVVTDDGAIRTGLSLLRFTLHGHVRSFGNDDFDHAATWVAA